MRPDWRSSSGWAAASIAVLFTLGSALACVFLRTVEVSAEYDRYHLAAEQLLRGHVVFDGFHPIGYPVLVVPMLLLVGNSLLAGQLVSSLAGGVVVWATSRIAEHLRPGAGTPTALLLAVHGAVWIHATLASSDISAVATMVAALALVVRTPAKMTMRRAVVVGLLLGLGVSVRSTSALVLACVGLWVLHREGLRAAFATAIGAVVGYAPHAIPKALSVAMPTRSENWHNFYLKVVCHFDYECLQRAQDAGAIPAPGDFFRAHAIDLCRLGMVDAWIACSQALPSIAFGSMQSEPMLWLWPLLLAVAGLAWGAHARSTGRTLLVITAALMSLTCFVSQPKPRLLLGAVPFLSAGIAIACMCLPRPSLRRVALALCVALSLGFGLRSFTLYLARQPEAEVALVRRLPDLVRRPMVLMTTLPGADRYVAAHVLGYIAPPFASPRETWDAVRERMEAAGVDVFLTGRVSNSRVFAHLTNSPLPPDFTSLYRDADTIVLERLPPASPWIEAFTVEPPSLRVGEPVVFRIRLSVDAVAAQTAGAGVAVRDANGEQSLFELPLVTVGVYEREFVVPSVLGDWQLTPFLLRANGQVLRGAVTPMRVRP